MRLEPHESEKAQRGELLCSGCWSDKVERYCTMCRGYFCHMCYGDETDQCFWCEAKIEEEEGVVPGGHRKPDPLPG